MSETLFTDAQRIKSSRNVTIVSSVTFYDVSLFLSSFSVCVRACLRAEAHLSEKFTIRTVIYSPFDQD